MDHQFAMVIGKNDTIAVAFCSINLISFGSSGGGMVLKQGKQFFLRGIVSISIALQNTLRCDPTNYAVFVDAAKFTNWIKTHI